MRVFLTGAGGVMGRHVVRHFANLLPGSEVFANKVDLTNLEAVKAALGEAGPFDKVIHLAAIVPVVVVDANPVHAFAVNVGGTINLLTALEGQEASFLYCSSSHIYAPSDELITENAEKAPISFYGRTKWAAENAAAAICEATGRGFCAARVFSTHDPAQDASYLRTAIKRRLAEENLDLPFMLQGAESVRDFLSAERAAELVVRLAIASATGPVNVGSGKGMKIRDFVQALSPRPLDIRAMGGANSLVADVSRLRSILGDVHV